MSLQALSLEDTECSNGCFRELAGLDQAGHRVSQSPRSLGGASGSSSGCARRLEKRHQGPMDHPTHFSGEVRSLPRKTFGLDRFGKSPGHEFVQCKVRRAFWETGQICTNGGKVFMGCQNPLPLQGSAKETEPERGENEDSHPSSHTYSWVRHFITCYTTE